MKKSFFHKFKETVYSFEILPPLREASNLEIYNILYYLMEFNPPFINVTFHRDNVRTGTIALCGTIMQKYEVDAIPHLTCSGLSKQMVEDTLIELNFLGVCNILILRGDKINFPEEKNISNYSIELVEQIVTLKNRFFLSKTLISKQPSTFCIGIAGYPEKHFEAPNIKEDIFRLSEKIKTGASFVVTQMFFDNNLFFDYVEIINFATLKVLIIPGIKPISSIGQIRSIPANFYINLPTNFVDKIVKYKYDILHIGIKWAIYQSIELKEAGIPVIHYFTMSKPDNIYQIVIDLINNYNFYIF